MTRDILPTSTALQQEGMGVGPLQDLMSVQLRRVDILLTRSFFSLYERLDLRSGMISCLALIVANPGISQKQLSEQIGRDKSIIVGIVNELEDRNWAKRTRSRTDHRRYQLVATPEGERQLDKIADRMHAVEDTLLTDVTAEDLATLSAILERMHNSCMATIRNMAEK